MLRQKRAGHEASTPSGGWGFLRIENRVNQVAYYEFIVIVSIDFIMNVNSTYHSHRTRPLPSSVVPNPLSGRLNSVRNVWLDFDSKPSHRSSAAPVKATVFRKIVGVFQVIRGKQASQVPCQGGAANSQLDISRTGLMKIKPNTTNVLLYLDQLIKYTNIGWAAINHDKPKDLCDQVARRNFNRTILEAELGGKSSDDCAQMLKKLKGEYGRHLRGVLDFAAERVGRAEEDSVKVSTAYNYPFCVEDLIITLHERLGHGDVPVEPGADIHQFSELTSKDIKALSSVGISVETLTTNSY